MADEDEEEDDKGDDDSPESEKPASEKKAEVEKPVSKSVEWGIAIAMMAVLIGLLVMMIYLMRSARSAVM